MESTYLIAFLSSMLSSTMLLFLSWCLQLMKMTGESVVHNSTTVPALPQPPVLAIMVPLPSAPAQPSSVIEGLDDSKIKSYTELVVVGKNQSISGHGNKKHS